MQLHELDPEERAFLEAHGGDASAFARRLGQRLAAALTARLRMPIEVRPDAPPAPLEAGWEPVWRPDGNLASLWLTRRLGGGRVVGQAGFVPRSLVDTLDALLAECWIEDGDAAAGPQRAWAWSLTAAAFESRLELLGADRPGDMARWAQGVMRRG